ncbi:DUF3945 domain-containing protein [Dysgonomonas sp. ZJ709]|uniref:DUF3945 domain-containing protein n=1 Tax=Dysgonomonas sp. ZJ709 TaxID=2709797 RepID=UPI0013ED9CE2|nr:DUF3945 domain-containing protein [Dysgonomonas sp. ZJ709]
MANQQNKAKALKNEPAETPGKNHIFIADNQKQTVDAVSGVDEKGKLKTVPAQKKNQKDFLEIGNNSDVIDLVITALKNFQRQAKDPNRFNLFKLPTEIFKEAKANLKEIFSGFFSKDAEKSRIDPEDLRGAANQNNSKQSKEKEMAKTNQTNQQEPIGDVNTDKKYRIMPGMVDWNALKQMGISKELLEKKGFLDSMLQGRKSPDTMYLNINMGKMTFQGDAKLSLQKQDNGTYSLRLHPVKLEPEFNTPYRGHAFTAQDKQNLLSTGNMGRVVDLIGNDFQMTPSVISLDRKTNEIHSLAAAHIYVPDKIAGVELQKHEIETLKAGEAVKIEGFVSKAGKPFDAVIQADAVDRRVAFQFDNEPGIYNKLGGVELSKQQQQDLQAGKVIRMEDMTRKGTGEQYDAYVKLDPVGRRPVFTSYNPDTPEGAREIIIPKYVGSVKLEADDRKDLAKGGVVFVKDMTDYSGNITDKFIKMHPESGKVMMSNFPDGFDENQKPKLDIPKELFGVKISSGMRAKIQDGKAVEIKGAVGTDGKPMPLWVKANRSNTAINTFHSDPDAKRNQTQTAVIPRTPEQSETNKKASGQRM